MEQRVIRALRSLKLCLAWLAASAMVFAAPTALAQTDAMAAIANLKGPEREARLLAGAKKEGQLALYTSLENSDAMKLTAAFEKRYGVKVVLWRSSSDAILSRVLTETRGNRFVADVIETNGLELEALQREKMLQPFRSPYTRELIADAVQPHGQWIATRMHVYWVAYNTQLIKKEDLPKSYSDLLDPAWKGKIGVEATNYPWFAAVIEELGEREGLQLFRNIVKTNGISTRKGHNLLANLVASGEVPLALTTNQQAIVKMKKGGAPVDGFFPQFGVAMLNGVAIQRNAPHPHAAALFADFMLSDGQDVLHELDRQATARRHQSTSGTRLRMINASAVLDQSAKWEKLYQDIVIAPAK